MRAGSEAGAGPVDVTPPGFSLRTTVHEYGGSSFTVVEDVVYFSNYADQRLYRQALSGGTDWDGFQLTTSLCPDN